MATPFSEIYILFLSQITDYELSQLEDEAFEENAKDWLINAIGYYTNCRKNLMNYNEDSFEEDLDYQEKNILATFMLYVYLNTYVLTEQNLKQSLNSKDYRMYSPANQLKALLEVKRQIKSDADTLMSRYSYNIHNIKEMWKT